jgi:hypothetical protein
MSVGATKSSTVAAPNPCIEGNEVDAKKAALEVPDVPLQQTNAPKKKRPFRMHASGAMLFGRIAAGVGVVGVVLGSLLGDPTAMTGTNRTTETQVDHRTAQKEASFVADIVGRATEIFAPFGLDRDQVLRSLTDASVAVNLDGTRYSASVSRGGVRVAVQPSLQWSVDWMPDPHISSLAYDFSQARFSAQASGLGPDGIYSDFVADQANESLRPLLPRAMQQPGFDLWADRDIEQHLQQLFNVVRTSRPVIAGTSRPTMDGMSRPEVSLSFVIGEARKFRLPDSDREVKIARGTRVDVSAAFDGSVSDPRLSNIQIHFDRPVEISGLVLHSATIRPGGQVDLDYELVAEQVVDGLHALVVLFAAMSDPRVDVSQVRRTRMEGFRREVQQRIDNDLEPRLIDVLREHDHAIPGLSLSRVFGIDLPPQR